MFRPWLPRLISLFVLIALPSAAHAQFTVTRTSTPIFYNDVGETPSLQCAYASYAVTNTGGPATDVWVDIANFTGGVVGLAPGEDGVTQLGAMGAGETRHVFYYLRAASTTASAQGHQVRVYTAAPPGTPVVTQSFSFSAVESTIGANANKVTTVVSGPTPPGLGGIVTITVTGETGTIGGLGVLAFTPAAGLSWRPEAFEMIGVTITLSGSANAGVITDSLYYLAPAAGATDYVVQYFFRAVGSTVAPTLITPIGYIASGANIKHTDTGNFGSFPPIQPPANFVTVSKLASPARLVDGGHATWTVRFTNSVSYSLSIDDIVDVLPPGAVYLPGSSTFAGSPIADPVQVGQRLEWGSFFLLPGSGTGDLVYRTFLPPVYGDYVNSAFGHVGAIVVDSTSSITDSFPAHARVPVVRPDADVSILKTASPNPVEIGTPLVYRLIVTNAGPDTATAVSIVDTLSANSTFVSAITTAGSVSELSGVVTALLGRIAPGRSDTVTVTVTPTVLGALANVARAATDAADPDSADHASGTNVTVTPPVVPGPDLSTTKTSDGPFTVGTSGMYTITVVNTGTSATTAPIAVTDSLPTGTTFVSGAGTGWVVNEALGVVTASYAAALAAGDTASFTITAAIDAAALPSVTNSALASTTGDVDASDDRGTDTSAVNAGPAPDVATTKTSDGPFTVGTNGTYTISVVNTGTGPTTAAIAVTDSLPAGATFVSGAGTGWVVNEALGVVTATYAAALAAGDSATFTITVAVDAAALPAVTNSALAQAAGDTDASDDRGTDTTNVNPAPPAAPDLASTKTSDGPFTVGTNGTYTITVVNTGAGPTTAAIAVTDSLPAGTIFVSGAGTGWVVNEALGVVTATYAAALAAGDSATFTITVAIGAGALPSVTNSALASTPGDSDPADDRGTDTTTVLPAGGTPDIATTKTSDGPFTVGTNGTYTITVVNTGTAVTTGAIAVTDSLPTGTTFVSGAGAGWVVNEALGVVSGSYAAALAPGDTALFTITVAVDAAALPSVTNSALAQAAGDTDASDDRGTDTTTVNPAPPPSPDLATSKTSDGPFTVGTNGTYTITVVNSGAGPTTAAIAVLDSLPAGTTFVSGAGTGWLVNEALGVVSATYAAALAPGDTALFTITVAIDAAALPSVTNSALASTAGDVDPSDDRGTDTSAVNAGPAPDLATTKTSDGPFTVGTNGTYTITVLNAGAGPTTGAISVTDSLPAGTTFVSGAGAGWVVNESAGVVTATYAAALAAGNNAVFTITVAVDAAALPSVTNSALAQAAGDTDAGNDRGTDTTIVNAAPALPDIAVRKSAVNAFVVGQLASYRISVTNVGGGATTAPISLVDVLPAGLTYFFAAGTGWSVTPAPPVIIASYAGTLAPGDSAILLIDVTVGAGALPSVTNTASAGTAGDPTPGNDSGTAVTAVGALPDVALRKSAVGVFAVGTPGTYRLVAANVGLAPTTGAIAVVDTLPAGLTYVGSAGAGWSIVEAGNIVTATYSDPLAAGDSTAFTIDVSIDNAALPAVTNTAVATTAGDASAANDRAVAPTIVGGQPDLALAKAATGTFTVGSPGTYVFTVRNLGTAATSAPIVVRDTLSAGLTFGGGAGAGWSFGVAGNIVTATYAAALADGDSLSFSLTVGIGLAAYPSVTNSAVVSSTGDPGDPDDRGSSGPVDVGIDGQLALDKSVGTPDVEVASAVTYTLRVRNIGGSPVPDVAVVDSLPLGFRFVGGSARIDGTPIADPAGAPGRTLTFAVGTVPSASTRTLTYRTFVDAAALYGDGVNRAVAMNDDLDVRSNAATAAVRVRGGAFASEGILAGKVWLDCDCDGDRTQGDAEPGIPGVRVYLEDGRSAITDVEGKYVFSPVSPRLHVVKIDRTTLPAGAELVVLDTRNAGDAGTRFVDLQNGEFQRADFAERTCAPGVLAEVRARRAMGEVRASLATGLPFPTADANGSGAGFYEAVQPDGSLDAANSRRLDAPGQPGLLTTHPPGRSTLELSAPRSAVPADGRTLIPITVKANEGTTRVTLEAEAGMWRVHDLDPKLDGVQTDVTGSTTFLLVAPERGDRARVRVTRVSDLRGDPLAEGPEALKGADLAETTIAFVPTTRPWIVAGVLEGRLDQRSLEDGELAAGQVRDRFQESLDDLSSVNDDGTQSIAGRGAVFARGGIDPKTLVTLRYDSEKAGDKRRFDDIRPDEGYPIFGDASIPGFETQSTDRLFARVDRDRSHLVYGDFVTAGASPTRVLGTYVRSLNGAMGHVEGGRMSIDAFASHERDRQVVDELPGRGISGPYSLSRADGLFGSERIEVVTRDRNNPSVILDRRALTRFADYSIEPYSGRVLFRQPIASVDERLNPVSIRVVYEVAGGGDRFWTAGANGSFKPTSRVELGGTYVREDDPMAERTFTGAGGTLALTRRTFLTGEWASSDADSGFTGPGAKGDAWRAEMRHRSDRFDARGYMVRTDAGFDNPSSGFAANREEAGGAGRFTLNAKTALTAEGVRSKDRATDGRRKGAMVGLERRLGGGLLAELGYRWARESALPAGGGPIANTPNEVDAVRARLAAQFDRRKSAYLEFEQETGAKDQHRMALGGDARLSDHLRLYGRHEFLSSFAGPYALNSPQGLSTTLFGITADGARDLSAFSEYRVRDSFDGRRAEAAMGLRNRWAISPAVRLDASLERVSPVRGAGTAGPATAITGGVEWIGDPRTKGTARLEYRSADEGHQALASGALARKLSRDWTGLVRTNWSWRPGGAFVAARSQLGLALRETDRNTWNGLLRLEHRFDRDGRPATGGFENRAFVTSAHVNVHPSRRFTLMSQAAAKWSEERAADGSARNQASLVGGRGLYELTPKFDVAVAARSLFSGSMDRRNDALGAELGWTPAKNLRLAGGFNAFGFKDPDIVGVNRTDRGGYVDFGFKFDEMLFGGGGGGSAASATPAAGAVDAGWTPAPAPAGAPATTLTPTADRITDQAIARDRATIDAWDARFAALPDTTPLYPRAKGRAWLDLARGALAADDRSGAADSALVRAVDLYAAVADSARSLDSTFVVAASAATLPRSSAGMAALPADLVTRTEALATHAGGHCAAVERARLEVALAAIARRAEAAADQVPCRLATSIDDARRLADEAMAKAEECVKPIEPPVVVDTTLPPPVAPNAEIEEALREIPSGIHFAVNKHTLAPASVDVCRRIAAVLAKYPHVRVELEGHTDSRGSAAYNLALSQRRVDAVKAGLVAAGVEDGRITTSFAGKEGLLTAERDVRELALNRRVDFKYFDDKGNSIAARKQTDDIQVETPAPRRRR